MQSHVGQYKCLLIVTDSWEKIWEKGHLEELDRAMIYLLGKKYVQQQAMMEVDRWFLELAGAIEKFEYKQFSKRKLMEREKAIMNLLDHPNIIKLLKLVDDQKNGFCYMVMEYAGGGELFNYIVSRGRLNECEARKFIRQIISAIEYCHANLIVHRDLKPENLLLDESMNIKITDFGLSNIMLPGRKFETFCGSLHYACPEILMGENYVGPGVDIWAIGVILYCLVTGYQPWNAANSEKMLSHIFTDGIQIPIWISPECVDLIVKMLQLKEKDRIKLPEIRTHPWITKAYGKPPPSYLPKYSKQEEINERIVLELVQIGFENDIKTRLSILNGKHMQVVATYHNLLKKSRNRLQCFNANAMSRAIKEDSLGLRSDDQISLRIENEDTKRTEDKKTITNSTSDHNVMLVAADVNAKKNSYLLDNNFNYEKHIKKLESKSSAYEEQTVGNKHKKEFSISGSHKSKAHNFEVEKKRHQFNPKSSKIYLNHEQAKKSKFKDIIDSIFNMSNSKVNAMSSLKNAFKNTAAKSSNCFESKKV